MKNFIQRALTGFVFVLSVAGSIYWHPIAFASLFLIVVGIGITEFLKISANVGAKPSAVFTVLTGLILFALISLTAQNYLSYTYLFLFFPLLFSLTIFELYRKSETSLLNIGLSFMSILYVAVPLALLNFISDSSNHSILLLAFFALLWTNDTMAYVFGVSIGKHRLFERISPKKSWEGFIGGMISTMGIAFIMSLYSTQLNQIQWVAFGAIIVAAGTLGDLVESMLKRNMKIKDSGNILPGHGGILDRFDAVLIAAPFAVAFLMIIHS